MITFLYLSFFNSPIFSFPITQETSSHSLLLRQAPGLLCGPPATWSRSPGVLTQLVLIGIHRPFLIPSPGLCPPGLAICCCQESSRLQHLPVSLHFAQISQEPWVPFSFSPAGCTQSRPLTGRLPGRAGPLQEDSQGPGWFIPADWATLNTLREDLIKSSWRVHAFW